MSALRRLSIDMSIRCQYIEHMKTPHYVRGFEMINLNLYLKNEETRFLKAALKATQGNNAQAARLLCLKRPNFIWKLRKYGIKGVQ